MIDRKELKAAAKARMRQAEPSYAAVMLLYVLAAVVVPTVAQTAVSAPLETIEKLEQLLSGGIEPWLAIQVLQLSAGQVMASTALGVILTLYQGIMAFGLAVYCLRLYRGQPCGPADLFCGFSMPGRIIGQRVLVAMIFAALGIGAMVLIVLLAVFANMLGELLGSLVLIAAAAAVMVLIVVVMLNYSLAALALADRPELGAMGSIQLGKNLMRGHKGQFVILTLSFFGWMWLCVLPSVIFTGTWALGNLVLPVWARSAINLVLDLPYSLWLLPYIQTTVAGFYDQAANQGKLTELPPL